MVGIILINGCGEEESSYEEQPSKQTEEDIEPVQECVKEGIEWFQTGNIECITKLQIKQSHELEDNRIGAMWTLELSWLNEEEVADWLEGLVTGIDNLGLKLVRTSLDWFDWNEVRGTDAYSKFYVDPNQDKTIEDFVNKDIKIMYTLVYWDKEIPEELDEQYSRFKTEEEIQRYLDYTKFIVSNFKDKIEYYELLNEPNIDWGTQQYVESNDYVNLARRVIPVIKEEDPKAKIVLGAVTPFNEPNAFEYFLTILRSDIITSVDAVSWHAGSGASPQYLADYYNNYPNLIKEIKETASANGFKGEYIAEELHWRTSETPHSSEYTGYSTIASAKYYARGIVMHQGMDITTGLAAVWHDDYSLKERVIQNLATILAGAKAEKLEFDIQTTAENIKSYSFTLSNGDKLIAIWDDKAAADNDPGIKSDLTFDGFSGNEIIGIDVLNGYTQSIVTNGNKIEGLIVRDYPIVLHIKK
jgi:hypothetical protein